MRKLKGSNGIGVLPFMVLASYVTACMHTHTHTHTHTCTCMWQTAFITHTHSDCNSLRLN